MPDVVGWVFDEPVTAEMLATYLEEHPPPAAVGDEEAARSRWAARAVMTGILVRQETRRRELADQSELPAAVAAELTDDRAPTAAEVQGYFERNRLRFDRPERRRARHVLCDSDEEARGVAERARSGEPFRLLAEQFSIDRGSRAAGGDLGWLRRGELAGEVEEQLFSAAAGQIIGPVRSPFGWHVLVVTGIEEARPADFASVRAQITDELAERRRREAYVAWLEQRALDGIAMAPGHDHPFRPSFLEWAHRH